MNKKILSILLVLFIGYIVLQHHMPKPVEWNLSFSGTQKKPYGCKVIKDLLDTIFPGAEIELNQSSFFLSLNQSESSGENLIIVTDRFSPDEFDMEALLAYTARGNSVFISSLDFPKELLDTLALKTNITIIDTSLFKRNQEKLILAYSPESDSTYLFTRRMAEHYFTSYDSATSCLGYDRAGRINFIHRKFGYGTMYLHCQPLAFTNYHILYGNFEYACAALSVLPVRNTIWDQYYKPEKFIDSSPVRYILSNPPLRSAWYVLLAALTLYLIFGSKRLQRPVLVIRPPENTSLNFIKSVGKLYYRSHNHGDLVKKKISYFKDFLRTRYNFKNSFSNDHIPLLREKSGVDNNQLEKLFNAINGVEGISYPDKDDLINLHHEIEKFYKTCK